jgi:lipopolysaccharide/colanic/teichoic acid biosynthesis glycosyltransferase
VSRRLQLGVKWLFDRVGSALLLVLLSPLFVGLAAWIILESGRPVFLVQQRVLRGGRPFGLFKFRTMVPDALEAGKRMGLADPFGVLANDPRITRSGRWLRRTSLDELPQLANVLLGQMSLVGPRPDLVEQVANYTDHDRRRLAMRPGLTGWSQVHGRDSIGWPERIEQDIWYVDNWSLWLDVKVLAKTVGQFGRPEPTPVEDTTNIERARRRIGEVQEVDVEEWEALTADTDVYFRHDYITAAAIVDDYPPVFLHLPAEEVVFTAILRDDPLDVTTPYGFGGPVSLGDPAGLERFWPAYDAWCRDRGVVASFVRFHPLLRNDRHAAGVHVETVGHTVAWRLDQGRDLLGTMDRHHRRLARRAEREGLTATVECAPASVESFVGLYEETMKRNEAADFYFFPRSYWDALVDLGEKLLLVEVRREAELAANAICLAGPTWLHYHLGGSSDEGRRLGASHLALLAAARWGQEHGRRILHLGGGVGGRDDSLFDYKRRFAPDDLVEATFGKVVHDEEAYRRLSGMAEISFEGFFPAYRDRARSLTS